MKSCYDLISSISLPTEKKTIAVNNMIKSIIDLSQKYAEGHWYILIYTIWKPTLYQSRKNLMHKKITGN